MGSKDLSALQPLIQARSAALENPSLYPQVLPPILGLLTDKHNPSIELRRWVADFLAEILASPVLETEEKEKMALLILPVLKTFLDTAGEDVILMKNVIQAAASLYPLIFRYIMNNPEDSPVWQMMTAIKSTVLRTMDSVAPGIKICCIKFVQQVVQTQMSVLIADSRHTEKKEPSLSLVPQDHPLISPANLEAETSALLDRILGFLQDDASDTLLITATLNSLGGLIKTRPSISTKIINTVLMFNPLKFGIPPITTKTKIIIRSLERTARALLVNVLKRNPNPSLAVRIQAYIERLQQSRIALFEEASRKRPADTELAKATDSTKRQRTDEPEIWSPVDEEVTFSVAQLFSLASEAGPPHFDVQSIPQEIVAKLIVPLLRTVDKSQLDNAVNIVLGRYMAFTQAHSHLDAVVSDQSMAVDDDEDYEPEYQPIEDAEQVKNLLEMESSEDLGIGIPKPSQVSLGPFSLPPPRPLNKDDLHRLTTSSMDNVLRRFDMFPQSAANRSQKAGFNRLAASSNDRQATITTYIRLITRPTAGLSPSLETNGVDGEQKPKIELSRKDAMTVQVKDLCDRSRQQLLHYILNDWSRRMDIATTWLTEEWYNDKVCEEMDKENKSQSSPPSAPNFSKWAHHFLDELSAFIGSEHTKLLVRFVSEVPGLDAGIIDKIKKLALDPERVVMVVSTIHYLTLYRPPIRELCLDAIEDLWRNYDGAKGPTTGVLRKFRPSVLEADVKQDSA